MKGIIYKIVCNETGEVYYGSTRRSLNNRMTEHKCNCKRWKEGKYCYTTSFKLIERGNYSYSLIETVECEDKKQLEERERYYIENNVCINRNVPTRTQKEYNDLKRDDKKEYDKNYRQLNHDKIKANNKAYCELHKEQKKEYDRIRRTKLKQQELINNN
jgi:hypothetical protein